MKRSYAIIVFSSLMAVTSAMATAQLTTANDTINARIHPNLASAQEDCVRAAHKIHDAQEAHEFDLDGHAQKALDLIDEANIELKKAAIAAYKEHH